MATASHAQDDASRYEIARNYSILTDRAFSTIEENAYVATTQTDLRSYFLNELITQSPHEDYFLRLLDGSDLSDDDIYLNILFEILKTLSDDPEDINGLVLSALQRALTNNVDPHTTILAYEDDALAVDDAISSTPPPLVDPNLFDFELMEGNIAYIHIKSFHNHTIADELKIIIAHFESSDQPPDSYIIDVRDNSGGFIYQGLEAVDLFLSDVGPFLSKGNTTYSEGYFIGDITSGREIQILVNERTASMAEYFAGIMQHYGRARIVGVPTFGKGTSQSGFILTDQFQLNVTTFMPLIGGETSHQNIGIIPDVGVDAYIRDDRVGEAQYINSIALPDDIASQEPEVMQRCNLNVPDDTILNCALRFH